ncbi:MAG: class I SAM-dependent methyltransferase [Planctomycetes bacterium]|nr:class I SAM-dependent methyltransferase [Planctomycetota bacterium]MCA8947565.1 class I SAM-dependent methyltransferase [Planctomycetota bacterium]
MDRDPDIQREWLRLFDRFVLRLIELKPESVLDVGCGRGVLVNQLSQAGILATGIDPKAPGHDPQIIQGDVERLPFGDDDFEWVTLRHVPHHLPDLSAALRECVRVTRKGLLIAEPWFDLTDPLQKISERWDRWWKRQHERAGDVHKACIPVSGIVAALPVGDFDIEAEHYRHVAHITPEAIEKLSKPLLDELPPDNPDRGEYTQIMQQINERGFTYNGTVIVKVTRG